MNRRINRFPPPNDLQEAPLRQSAVDCWRIGVPSWQLQTTNWLVSSFVTTSSAAWAVFQWVHLDCSGIWLYMTPDSFDASACDITHHPTSSHTQVKVSRSSPRLWWCTFGVLVSCKNTTIYMYCNQTSGYKRFLLRYEKRNSAGKWFIRTSFDYCHHRISKSHMWLLEKGVQGEFNGSIGKRIWYIYIYV